eukprot:761548-Hanusia_phi.AAC.4
MYWSGGQLEVGHGGEGRPKGGYTKNQVEGRGRVGVLGGFRRGTYGLCQRGLLNGWSGTTGVGGPLNQRG